MADTGARPTPETLAAWSRYVERTEARISRELAAGDRFLASDFDARGDEARIALAKGTMPIVKLTTSDDTGREISVPGGAIAHWRGAILLPGMTLDGLLNRVQHPERYRLPDDVVSLDVVGRKQDELRLAMRLTRTKIVTVTYDTEHLATYRRHAATRASSRSVSTKVVEIADAGTASERALAQGEDRGFLWKMNSYWRYEEVPAGVIVELESLTLSRNVPFGLGVVVDPIVARVARESIQRTLKSVQTVYGAAAVTRWSPLPSSRGSR